MVEMAEMVVMAVMMPVLVLAMVMVMVLVIDFQRKQSCNDVDGPSFCRRVAVSAGARVLPLLLRLSPR